MTREEAYKTVKENLCVVCAYGSQNMESCDIKDCDNRDAIKALEQEPTSPCDVCRYNPPSSTDGKPCCMCPAEKGEI